VVVFSNHRFWGVVQTFSKNLPNNPFHKTFSKTFETTLSIRKPQQFFLGQPTSLHQVPISIEIVKHQFRSKLSSIHLAPYFSPHFAGFRNRRFWAVVQTFSKPFETTLFIRKPQQFFLGQPTSPHPVPISIEILKSTFLGCFSNTFKNLLNNPFHKETTFLFLMSFLMISATHALPPN